MKVRIGVGFLGWPFPKKDPGYVWEYVDMVEDLGLDSIWLADRIVSDKLSLESMTFMGALAGRTKRIKFGNSVLALPLRNPVVLAKEIATVDFLSGGRMLPAVGLGTDLPNELEACGGIDTAERAGRTDEAIDLMRRLWTEDAVTFRGKYFRTTDATIEPKPVQQPAPPIWIGGRTEPAFRRVGRRGDGWMPAAMTPEEVGLGIQSIRRHAEAAGRHIPEDHYGSIISFCFGESREEARATAAPYMLRIRRDVDPESMTALGTAEEIAQLIRRYVDQGASKFVMRAACPPEQTLAQTERLARELAPIFHGA